MAAAARPARGGGPAAHAQGPSLVLHPLSPPGAAPVVFTSQQVDWPEAWNERRPPPCVVLDLRDHGSVEIDAVARGVPPWLPQATAPALPSACRRAGPRCWAWHSPPPWSVSPCSTARGALGCRAAHAFCPAVLETSVTEGAAADGRARSSPARCPVRGKTSSGALRCAGAANPGCAAPLPRLPAAAVAGVPRGHGRQRLCPARRQDRDDRWHRQGRRRQGPADDALVGVLAHEDRPCGAPATPRAWWWNKACCRWAWGWRWGCVGHCVHGRALLTGLSYRRSHEREADCYAIDLMRHAALPTAPMGALLLAIAHEEEAKARRPVRQPLGQTKARPVQTPRRTWFGRC